MSALSSGKPLAMFLQHVADAMNRARSIFERRPQAAVSENSIATARWTGVLRTEVRDPYGRVFHTDMPEELGGGNQSVTPGWFFRAGLASCASTSILMVAADAGIELEQLEVAVHSLSDARGMLGQSNEKGESIHPGPLDMTLRVSISSHHADDARLRELVTKAMANSPIPGAVRVATPLAVEVDVVAAKGG
jgi:uncharacterized OsmC-like protein